MAWENLMTLCDIKVKVIKKINSFCRQKTGWLIHAEPFMLWTEFMFSKFILYPFWATFKCPSIYSNLLKFTQIYLHHHVQHWHWISLFPAIIIVSWHLRLSASGKCTVCLAIFIECSGIHSRMRKDSAKNDMLRKDNETTTMTDKMDRLIPNLSV